MSYGIFAFTNTMGVHFSKNTKWEYNKYIGKGYLDSIMYKYRYDMYNTVYNTNFGCTHREKTWPNTFARIYNIICEIWFSKCLSILDVYFTVSFGLNCCWYKQFEINIFYFIETQQRCLNIKMYNGNNYYIVIICMYLIVKN